MEALVARIGFWLFALAYWRRSPSWLPKLSRKRVQVVATVVVLVTVAVDAVTMGLDHASFYVTAALVGYVYAGIMGAGRCV